MPQDKIRVPAVWLSHLLDKEKEDFKQYLLNSTALIDKVLEILDHRISEVQKKRVMFNQYEHAAFPYAMADCNGAERELNFLKDLFTFERK